MTHDRMRSGEPLRVAAWDALWEESRLVCFVCGWSGPLRDTRCERFAGGADHACPLCEKRLIVRLASTTPDDVDQIGAPPRAINA